MAATNAKSAKATICSVLMVTAAPSTEEHDRMSSHRSGSGGAGLERSCADGEVDWIWQSAVVGGVELWEARLQRLAYRRHRHDTYAISLTTTGVQAFAYRGASHASLPGQVVVLHPDEPHDGHAGTDAGFSYRQLYVEPAALFAALRAIRGSTTALPFARDPVMTNGALASAIHAAFQQEREQLATDELLVRIAEGLLSTDAGGGLPLASRQIDLVAIDRARQVLDAETSRVVRSEELEAVTGLSRFELARHFRAAMGTSPYRYSLLRRLDTARAQIARGRPLVDVALDLGFADQAHFTRRFTAAFGITPGEYRRLTGQDVVTG
jgi:AraC-like DNA-binding protein